MSKWSAVNNHQTATFKHLLKMKSVANGSIKILIQKNNYSQFITCVKA